MLSFAAAAFAAVEPTGPHHEEAWWPLSSYVDAMCVSVFGAVS
jgi:hypothetical protein